MGLIAFSLIGCSVALEHGYPRVVVIMAGMLTGISGGIVRDVLCNQVPVVFRRELYASVSLAVCLLYWLLQRLECEPRLQHRRVLCRWPGVSPAGHSPEVAFAGFSYQERWE